MFLQCLRHLDIQNGHQHLTLSLAPSTQHTFTPSSTIGGVVLLEVCERVCLSHLVAVSATNTC